MAVSLIDGRSEIINVTAGPNIQNPEVPSPSLFISGGFLSFVLTVVIATRSHEAQRGGHLVKRCLVLLLEQPCSIHFVKGESIVFKERPPREYGDFRGVCA